MIYIYNDNNDIYAYACIHSQGLCLIQDFWIRCIALADISDDDDDMDPGTPDLHEDTDFGHGGHCIS
jgi:hypothetical protein